MEREKGRERIRKYCEYERESCQKVVTKRLYKYHFSFSTMLNFAASSIPKFTTVKSFSTMLSLSWNHPPSYTTLVPPPSSHRTTTIFVTLVAVSTQNLTKLTTRFKKNRKKGDHGNRGNDEGMNHHRILFDKYHPGYIDKIASLIPKDVKEKALKENKGPVIDNQPFVVKTKLISKIAEKKNKEVVGAGVLAAYFLCMTFCFERIRVFSPF
ncbi:transmembrane protein, putative [Medicago truncatula]|uniref:Transmembrane protein, putative n=1 Tax=Medicago truncatula TaxID=3880 RepID=G7JKB1_MEDTR|nr:transmembrane protein, putative [Medicago truncatula]